MTKDARPIKPARSLVSQFSCWLPWTTRDGRQVQFKMPAVLADRLANTLDGLWRRKEIVSGRQVTESELVRASVLASALVLLHGPTMRVFVIDRRGMTSDQSRIYENLNLSEWFVRRAREILEHVGFIRREPTFDTRAKRTAQGWRNPPTKFVFGPLALAQLQRVRQYAKKFKNEPLPARTCASVAPQQAPSRMHDSPRQAEEDPLSYAGGAYHPGDSGPRIAREAALASQAAAEAARGCQEPENRSEIVRCVEEPDAAVEDALNGWGAARRQRGKGPC